MDLTKIIDILSLLVHVLMLLDVPIQVLMLISLGSKGIEDFGHVFVRCLNAISEQNADEFKFIARFWGLFSPERISYDLIM